MRQRDRQIIDNLNRFRCMTRDDIVDIHFGNIKGKINGCNLVLKRLTRDGHIEVNKNTRPYTYFPSPSPIKKDSTKIPHFLKIVNFYQQVRKYSEPRQFTVEPKYGKEHMEPDVFMIWRNAPFFVEVQRSTYSEKVMQDKFDRYEKYFLSDQWKNEMWQPKGKEFFPYLWLIADSKYNISTKLKVFQSRDVDELMTTLKVVKEA